MLGAVLRLVNPFARIPLCGLVSRYNAAELPPGAELGALLMNRLTVRGFIVSDHVHRLAAFLAECGHWVRDGKLEYRENLGKLLVRVAPDPTR